MWILVAAVLLGTGWGSNQFSPMLLVYRQELGLSTGTLEAMFGFYALGLIPGLLVAGPLSDARGRRAVVIPAAALALAASLTLLAAGHSLALLLAGRLLAGVAAGSVFSAGTAWLRELSRAPFGDADDHTAARRAAIAMTAGFAGGPLVAGLLAQWAPAPRVMPYLPHVVLMTAVLVALRSAPETVTSGARGALRLAPRGVGNVRFRKIVAPMAPWVFAAPVVAFALLPSVVGADEATDGIALTAAITALCAFTGVLIQPLGRRLDAQAAGNRPATVGLLVVAAGLALSALAAEDKATWLLVPCAIIMGGAYGLCLVAGLVEIQRLADKRSLAALTAAYYTLTYLGFGAPYLLALGARVTSYTLLLAVAAALALGTAALVTRRSAQVVRRSLV
jgi:Major Facilitator Superfamily